MLRVASVRPLFSKTIRTSTWSAEEALELNLLHRVWVRSRAHLRVLWQRHRRGRLRRAVPLSTDRQLPLRERSSLPARGALELVYSSRPLNDERYVDQRTAHDGRRAEVRRFDPD